MGIAEVNLSKRAFWLIQKDDPTTFKLQSRSDWFFINPLIYRRLDRNYGNQPSLSMIAIVGKSVLVQTNTMYFGTSQGLSYKTVDIEEFDNYIRVFSANLRYASKQAEFSAVSISSVWFSDDLFELIELKPPSVSEEIVALPEYNFTTAITWKHLEIADKMLTNNNLPMFGTLLLDAIFAFQETDYRRTILYAAMAIEVLAASKLDETYETFLEKGDPKGMIRIISLSQRGGREIKKDPIYEVLSSRTDFTQLLHERPLYLWKRSLLVENESLYQRAEMLYRTRNKIVHKGDIPSTGSTSHYKIDPSDASKAIRCAMDIFKWFGEQEVYHIRTGKFVKLNVGIQEIDEEIH